MITVFATASVRSLQDVRIISGLALVVGFLVALWSRAMYKIRERWMREIAREEIEKAKRESGQPHTGTISLRRPYLGKQPLRDSRVDLSCMPFAPDSTRARRHYIEITYEARRLG